MKEFKDLEFKPHPNAPTGIQALEEFENGYSISVIRTHYSYGGDEGLYELAIFYDGDICYDTPITSDVEGYLTEKYLTKLMIDIQKLPMHIDYINKLSNEELKMKEDLFQFLDKETKQIVLKRLL